MNEQTLLDIIWPISRGVCILLKLGGGISPSQSIIEVYKQVKLMKKK